MKIRTKTIEKIASKIYQKKQKKEKREKRKEWSRMMEADKGVIGETRDKNFHFIWKEKGNVYAMPITMIMESSSFKHKIINFQSLLKGLVVVNGKCYRNVSALFWGFPYKPLTLDTAAESLKKKRRIKGKSWVKAYQSNSGELGQSINGYFHIVWKGNDRVYIIPITAVVEIVSGNHKVIDFPTLLTKSIRNWGGVYHYKESDFFSSGEK